MIIKMYRIFDERNGLPCTLFHGVNGSRTLPLDTWIDSNNKPVKDGSGQEKKIYLSGFHVLENLDDVINFSKRFRKLVNRVICAVDVDTEFGIWSKEHSRANVKLVKRMRINSIDWKERLILC